MELKKKLVVSKDSLLRKWIDAIVETYPPNSWNFFKKQKNRFANPMGYKLVEGIKGLLDVILDPEEYDISKGDPFLREIIRIRAVQEFSPSDAVSFIFSLKALVKAELDDLSDDQVLDDWGVFESDLDKLMLRAFDMYMECRQRLFDIRISEVTTRTIGALKRANVIWDPDGEEQVKGNNI